MSSLEMQEVQALSPATFTNKPTFTDTGALNFWQATYINSNSTVAYFVDSNNTHVKAVKLNMADGTVIATVTAALPASGASAISDVEKTGLQHRVYFAQLDSGTAAYIGHVNIDTGAITSQSVTNGITGETPLTAVTTKNKVVYIWGFSGNNWQFATSARDLTGYSWIGNGGYAINTAMTPQCETVTDGATAASDKIVCTSASSSEGLRFDTIVGTTHNSIAEPTTNCTPAATSQVLGNVVNGIMVGRASAPTCVEVTALLNTASDTQTYPITNIPEGTDWLSLPVQTYDFDGTTRTFKTGENSKVYNAKTDKAISWKADGTQLDPDELYLESVTAGTGTLTAIDDAKYYRLSDTLIVSGSGATWTPRLVTSVLIQPTPYTEKLDVPLVVNSTIFREIGLIRVLCDGSYIWQYTISYNVGTDSDCTKWKILDTSSETVGRLLSYSRTRDLVHANPFTGYTIHVSTADPTQYFLTSIYNGKDVDSGSFDSGGDIAQYLLFAQCYTMQIEESLSGNILQTGNICANDVNPKTVSLSGITLPDDWLGNIWSHSITRYFNASDTDAPASASPSNNHVIFTVQKSITPYNASVHITDNPQHTETVFMDVPTGAQLLDLYSGGNIMIGETVANTNSDLDDRTINKLTVKLLKSGNPTGTIYFGVWDTDEVPTNSNYKLLIGTLDASTLTASEVAYTEHTFSSHLLDINDVVGIFYNNGNSGNKVQIFTDAANPYDGTDSHERTYSTFWSLSTGRDIKGSIAFDPTLVDEWYNFTDVTGASVVNRTGIFSNQTLYFTVYENDVAVINDVSQGRFSPGPPQDLESWQDNYGLLFGLPVALIFPILTAAVFPRSQAHIGIIATGAVIGIEQYFGLLKDIPFNEGIWAISFGLIALGVMYAKR